MDDNIIKYNDAVQQRQNESPDAAIIGQVSGRLYDGVVEIIDNARKQVAVYVNFQMSMTFWNVGSFIINDMEYQAYSAYGQKILATLSQKLMARYGKGYTYSALTRMMNVAKLYGNKEMFATLSQTLTWTSNPQVILQRNHSGKKVPGKANHAGDDVDFVRFGHTFPLPHNAT